VPDDAYNAVFRAIAIGDVGALGAAIVVVGRVPLGASMSRALEIRTT